MKVRLLLGAEGASPLGIKRFGLVEQGRTAKLALRGTQQLRNSCGS
jgi:hypothetical protein